MRCRPASGGKPSGCAKIYDGKRQARLIVLTYRATSLRPIFEALTELFGSVSLTYDNKKPLSY
jgi:hypothetical protein